MSSNDWLVYINTFVTLREKVFIIIITCWTVQFSVNVYVTPFQWLTFHNFPMINISYVNEHNQHCGHVRDVTKQKNSLQGTNQQSFTVIYVLLKKRIPCREPVSNFVHLSYSCLRSWIRKLEKTHEPVWSKQTLQKSK